MPNATNAPEGATRRGFLAGSTAAFAFAFSFPAPNRGLAQEAAPEVNAWVEIAEDETVTIRIARIEMGQGSLTGLAQLVAEELDCDWDRVTFDLVTPAANAARGNVWGRQHTGGSRAIRESHQYVREGGARARAMLVAAAAAEWGVTPADCATEAGVITHAASGRTTTYGAVASAAAAQTPPETVTLKDPADWVIAGQPKARLDTDDKLTGRLIYSADYRAEGMLVALPLACPVHGGALVSFDAAAVSAMPGVRHVLRVDDETVAVVADTFWQAKTALDALPVEWDDRGNGAVSSETIDAALREGLTAPTDFVGNRKGDAGAALSGATQVIEADYAYPYQNHAAMETLSATILWTPERCEMWGATQSPERALATLAAEAGLPPEACEINVTRIGGSFGRRLSFEYIAIAVRIARQIPGVPVKMMYTREEDMRQGRFHPVTRARLRASLSATGGIEALHMRLSGQSIAAYMFPSLMGDNGDPIVFQGLDDGDGDAAFGYSIPNLLIDHYMHNPHIRPGAWRGVNLNQNAIYMESFIDEVADAAGRDPLDLRRELLGDNPKALAVLEAAAEGIGWGAPAPAGRGRGLAQIKGFGAYVAAAAEVSVTDGRLRIHRIVAATDPGHVVNPQQIDAQVSGSFVYGLSAMLHGACTVRDGRIEQENFDTYNVMLLDEMPEVEVIAMPSGGFWGGVGEPTIAVAAPAVLNAIFAATGVRVREFPLANASLSGA